jgi:hypothetical protein
VGGELADQVELALQGVLDHDIRAATDEQLPDHRLTGSHQRRDLHLLVQRHVAPAQDHLALGPHRALELLLAGPPRGILLRQEHHADAVLSRRRQLHAPCGHFVPKQLVGNLQQDTGPVAEELVRAGRPAVIEVQQDAQAVLDDLVALDTLDVRNEPDAAGIVLVFRVVEPLGHGLRHLDSPET